MIIERDLEIPMNDGLILKADVYRPETSNKVPVILAGGPYGKGVKYQEHYKRLWDSLVEMHPDVLKTLLKNISHGKQLILKSGFHGDMLVLDLIQEVLEEVKVFWTYFHREKQRILQQ